MEAVQDFRALQEIQDELVEQGLMKAPTDAKLAAKSKAKAEKAAKKRKTVSPGGSGSPFRLFTSPAGLQILIGRNNRQNDELSTKVANGSHTFNFCLEFYMLSDTKYSLSVQLAMCGCMRGVSRVATSLFVFLLVLQQMTKTFNMLQISQCTSLKLGNRENLMSP